jgi:hypothetical protein
MDACIGSEGKSEKCDRADDGAIETLDEMLFWWGMLPELLGRTDIVSQE